MWKKNIKKENQQIYINIVKLKIFGTQIQA
jgi:hypothetical protein